MDRNTYGMQPSNVRATQRIFHWGQSWKNKRETDNHRQFAKLCEEIVEINERICDMRPVPAVKDESEMDELKKNCRSSSWGSTERDRVDVASQGAVREAPNFSAWIIARRVRSPPEIPVGNPR